MFHRLSIISIGLLTLATCQQKTIEKENSTAIDTIQQTKETPVVSNTAVEENQVSEPVVGGEIKQTAPAKTPTKSTENKNSTNNNSDKVVPQAGVIYLREGENIFLKERQMNVTFKNVVEDSRCPEGTNCIWEGVATAEIEFMGTYTRPARLKLSTLESPGKGYHRKLDFNGYSISLVSLTPSPSKTRGSDQLKGSYKVGLKIEKNPELYPQKPQAGNTTTR